MLLWKIVGNCVKKTEEIKKTKLTFAIWNCFQILSLQHPGTVDAQNVYCLCFIGKIISCWKVRWMMEFAIIRIFYALSFATFVWRNFTPTSIFSALKMSFLPVMHVMLQNLREGENMETFLFCITRHRIYFFDSLTSWCSFALSSSALVRVTSRADIVWIWEEWR